MSSKSKAQGMGHGSSAYGEVSQRGRGSFVKITALVLLIVAGMWVYLSTKSLEQTAPASTQRALDPGVPVAPGNR